MTPQAPPLDNPSPSYNYACRVRGFLRRKGVEIAAMLDLEDEVSLREQARQQRMLKVHLRAIRSLIDELEDGCLALETSLHRQGKQCHTAYSADVPDGVPRRCPIDADEIYGFSSTHTLWMPEHKPTMSQRKEEDDDQDK